MLLLRFIFLERGYYSIIELLNSEELRSLFTSEAGASCLILMAVFLYSNTLIISNINLSALSIFLESVYAAILAAALSNPERNNEKKIEMAAAQSE
jgi:hypothetical protein